MDPYGYVYNNPINLIDPTGMGPEDWFVNKYTGNVVKVQGVSNLSQLTDDQMSKYGLGQRSSYERLGSDDMFGKSVLWSPDGKNLKNLYDSKFVILNSYSQEFMEQKGFEKSSVSLVEKNSYEIKDFEGGGFDVTVNTTQFSDTKVLNSTINYRLVNSKDTEVTLSTKTSRDWTNTLKNTTVRSRVETKYNSNFIDSGTKNNSDSNVIKGAAAMIGEVIDKLINSKK